MKEFEALVRAAPEAVACRRGVDEAFVRWLAELEPRARVLAIPRPAGGHKDARRRG